MKVGQRLRVRPRRRSSWDANVWRAFVAPRSRASPAAFHARRARSRIGVSVNGRSSVLPHTRPVMRWVLEPWSSRMSRRTAGIGTVRSPAALFGAISPSCWSQPRWTRIVPSARFTSSHRSARISPNRSPAQNAHAQAARSVRLVRGWPWPKFGRYGTGNTTRARAYAAPSRRRKRNRRSVPPLLLFVEAVAQTPGEATESFLRAGSEIAHRIRHANGVHPEVVTASCSDGHLRERAAAFPGGLYATASVQSGG